MRLIPTLIARILPLVGLLAAVAAAPVAASPVLPDTLLRMIKADPASYLDTVAALIASYGAEDGLTAEQVDTSIALVRAKARATAMMPLVAADLDGDGTLTREEVVLAKSAASASGRSKLGKAFVLADVDGNAVVTPDELADFGAMAAMKTYSPARMAEIKVLLGFDADGDGKVTLVEVRAGLVGLVS